jgi:glycosyltransferase involved in cell wall biosynthesis
MSPARTNTDMNQPPPVRPILFFGTVAHFGGSNQVTVNLAKQLRTRRPVVVVDTYGNCKEYLAALTAARLDTRVLKPHPSRGIIGGVRLVERTLKLAASLPEMLTLVHRLRRLIRRIRPWVLVVSDFVALFVARYAIPASIPIVYYLMGDLHTRAWYVRCLFPRLDLLLGISQSVLRSVAGMRLRRTAVVYNGIDVAEIARLARAPVPPLPGCNQSLRLLLPASLIPTKGQDIAILAVARARQLGQAVHLWLSGSRPRGTDEGFPARLVELVARWRLEDCVTFVGWQSDICPVIAACDVVVLTSRTEGMPCALMQAMALQKPVIATRVGGIPELVRDGVDGVLVDVDDIEGTTAAIARLAEPQLRARMGAAGQARIAKDFSLARQAEALLEQLDLTTC